MSALNDDNDIVHHGGHTPANAKSCSLELYISLILDKHVMVN